jgi:hypothetical protein
MQFNAAFFEECCKHLYKTAGHTSDSIMIFSDNIMAENGSQMYIPFKNCTTFWENCGEMMQ